MEVQLFSEGFVLVSPEAEARSPVPFAPGAPDMQLLLLEERHCFRDHALEVCVLRRFQPAGGLDGSSCPRWCMMVGAGIGVDADFPEMAVGVDARRSRCGATLRGGTAGAGRRHDLARSSPLAPDLSELAEVVRQSPEAMYAARGLAPRRATISSTTHPAFRCPAPGATCVGDQRELGAGDQLHLGAVLQQRLVTSRSKCGARSWRPAPRP